MNNKTENFGKVAAFVDGYNLYRNIKPQGGGGWVLFAGGEYDEQFRKRMCWYRLDKIIQCGLRLEKSAEQLAKLSAHLSVNFYTAQPDAKDGKYSRAHYGHWIRLQGKLGANIVEGDFFAVKNRKSKNKFGDFNFTEKRTDVNIAVDMVWGACKGQYNTGVLISNDKDFDPAVKKAAEEGAQMHIIRIGYEDSKQKAYFDKKCSALVRSAIKIYTIEEKEFINHCLEADRIKFADGDAIDILPKLKYKSNLYMHNGKMHKFHPTPERTAK